MIKVIDSDGRDRAGDIINHVEIGLDNAPNLPISVICHCERIICTSNELPEFKDVCGGWNRTKSIFRACDCGQRFEICGGSYAG